MDLSIVIVKMTGLFEKRSNLFPGSFDASLEGTGLAAADHNPAHGAGAQEYRVQIDCHNGSPLLEGHILRLFAHGDARIYMGNVNAAHELCRLRKGCVYLIFLG